MIEEARRIAIRNENDLFEAIRSLNRGETLGDIRFEGWPRIELAIRGESFGGGVPTRIMPPLLKFQAAIDRAYARSLGRERLTREERQRAELIVRLESGSTTFFSDLTEALNHALAAAAKNMSGPQVLLSILVVAGSTGGYLGWRDYVRNQTEQHRLDVQVRLSELDNRRIEILTEAMVGNSLARAGVDDLNAARGQLFRNLEDGDVLVVGGEPLVRGDVARRLARNPAPERVQGRLDGDYAILSVDSGRVRSGFRIRVRDVKSREELVVSIPEGTLPPDQIEALQDGEWGKAPLHMRINVTRAGKRIVGATLVEAGLRRAD